MQVTWLLLAAVLLAAADRPAFSQVRPALEAVPPKTQMKLQLLDSTFIVGRLAALDETRIRLNTIVRPTATDSRLVPRTVALDSVTRAWVAEGTHWRRGAVVGALIGTVLIYALQHMGDDPRCGPVEWRCVANGVIVGGLPGALLGYAGGRQAIRWRVLL